MLSMRPIDRGDNPIDKDGQKIKFAHYKDAAHYQKRTTKDERWDGREVAWAKAERAKSNLDKIPDEEMRSQIIDNATGTRLLVSLDDSFSRRCQHA